ncbi:hypothetical protein V6154_09975 [Klebsiella pneumoniae]
MGPDPRNFNQRVSLGRNDLLIRTFLNTEAWKKLSDISQKLNRISLHIDSKSKDSQLTHTELFAVKRQLQELRQHLLNAEIWSKPYEGYAEDQKGYELRWCCSLCIAARSTS